MKTNRFLPLAAALVLCASFGNAARASVVVFNPNLPVFDNDVNGTPTGYAASGPITYFGAGLLVVVSDAVFHPVMGASFQITPQGPDEREQFDSNMAALVSVNGSPSSPATFAGPSMEMVLGKTGNVTGTFNTEMLSMNLVGSTGFGPMMIRESPTLPSTGQTSVTGLGGGQFRIDSFFDVFTELSIDGGASWIPSSGPPTQMTLVPEPVSATFAGLGVIFAASRRRRIRA